MSCWRGLVVECSRVFGFTLLVLGLFGSADLGVIGLLLLIYGELLVINDE